MDESKTKEAVWQTIQDLNRVWTVEGDADKLKDYFHQNMVAISPTHRERLEGRDACIAAWRAFIRLAKVLYWKEINPHIQIYGEGKAAIVTYYFEMSFDMGGQLIKSSGRDMFMLVNENGKWWVVGDQFSPYPQH